MNNLAILAEDENDEIFYEACAEQISGLSFTLHDPRRIRKNGGVAEVRKVLPAFLNDLKGLAHVGPTYFIIAIDNDRAPVHPKHERIDGISNRDRNKQCRVCELKSAIGEIFGEDDSKWPVKGAITVPVEMLESWVLTGADPTVENLPIYSRKNQSSAKNFFHGKPPDQLKDLCANLKAERSVDSDAELFLQIAEQMDLDAVSSASPSFRNFVDQVRLWTS